MKIKRNFSIAIVILTLASIMFIIGFDGIKSDIIQLTRGYDLHTDMNISEASFVSFLGERPSSASGISISGIGDVNGDWIDDMLIGASFDGEYAGGAGQTYLIFGNSSIWNEQYSLGDADASFFGPSMGMSGSCVAGAGDVNGDGLNDFLIGAYSDMEGGLQAGKAYLIFGKTNGWKMDFDLALSPASFLGQAEHEMCGYSLDGVGDVNGDGYDDIIIGTLLGKAYLFFGKSSGWGSNKLLSTADVTFIEETSSDGIGSAIAGAGDVNGDGYDDILLGASGNDDGGDISGQTYLIFGKSSGWASQFSVSNADASFIGENDQDGSGFSVASAGDVNGDGLFDILISANANNDVGKVYLIFGKSSDWSMDMELSNADSSYLGEHADDNAGDAISSAGDFNGDGYGDILIGARNNGEEVQGTGQTYVVFGREAGWAKDVSLSNANVSFWGEYFEDRSGCSVAPAGDIDGDGLIEIMIGAAWNDDAANGAGKTYLIKGSSGKEPIEVYSVKAFSDPGYSQIATRSDIRSKIYLELEGLDSDIEHVDLARINITFSKSKSAITSIYLRETGENTGIYRGEYIVPIWSEYLETLTFTSSRDPLKSAKIMVDYPFRPSSVSSLSIIDSTNYEELQNLDLGQTALIRGYGADSNPLTVDKAFVNLTSDKNSTFKRLVVLKENGQNTGVFIGTYSVPIWMVYFENITVRSVETKSTWTRFMVHTPLQIRTDSEISYAKEDEEYKEYFWNFGYEEAIWTVTEGVEWLEWDNSKKELYGIPDNSEVGTWEVFVRIMDTKGHNDTLNFDINVENRPPMIVTGDVLTADEDEDYYVDYNSDDDSQGEVAWYLTTSAPFLSIEKLTGVLSGHPINEDVGVWVVTIQTQDGNKGVGLHSFNLTVLNVNDRPIIITTDVKMIMQNDPFIKDYEVNDPDVGDSHKWTLMTDADWLTMNETTGILNGTPLAQDVGVFRVNITVEDTGGLKDYREFDLEVLDEPDPPFWDDVPGDITLMHGDRFYFDANATDYDVGDEVEYSIRSDPESDISINPDTGVIDWFVDSKCLAETSDRLEVIIKASDGKLFTTHTFYITILPTEPPVCTLISPAKGSKISITDNALKWNATDPENDELTYTIYIGESESLVIGLREEVRLVKDITGTEYPLTDFEPGKTYYWTVIPNDGCSLGTCINGPFNFKINNKPTITDIDRLSATQGKGFSVKIVCNELDTEDSITYTLFHSPKGMEIKSDTGFISWTPGSDQAGENKVVVRATDGYDTAEMTFFIDVEEGKGIDVGMIASIGIGILLIIIVLVLVYFLVVKRKSEEKGRVDESESDEIANEIEQHQREKEWEEAHMRPGGSNVVTSVPLSASEAHAHDHDGKPKSYEELYGARMSEE